MKDHIFTLIIIIETKRSGDLKSRGCANGSYQKICAGTSEFSSPTPDFFSFKYVCITIAKEGSDVAGVDLPDFFLQAKKDDEEMLLFKINSVVSLLLAESYPKKWKKHLRGENGKRVMCTPCDETTHGTSNEALLSNKKLAKKIEDGVSS